MIAYLDRVALFLAASLMASTPSLANASELGRLFYTPQERTQLEAQQASGATIEGVKRNFIVVNGVIQKQGGNRIVWLNGEAQTPVRANSNPASIDVAVPGKSKHVPVKVGQRLMLDTPSQEQSRDDIPTKATTSKSPSDEDD
ncbi:MAG: hypothetical protein WCT35_06140 [Sideroxydans sp.]|jgi:hypothetical protein